MIIRAIRLRPVCWRRLHLAAPRIVELIEYSHSDPSFQRQPVAYNVSLVRFNERFSHPHDASC